MFWTRIRLTLEMIKFEHSIFALPFALTGALLAVRDGGKLGPLAQLNIQVPAPHMGRIEDAHMIVCHMIGYYFMEE